MEQRRRNRLMSWSRRRFLKWAALGLGGASLAGPGCSPIPSESTEVASPPRPTETSSAVTADRPSPTTVPPSPTTVPPSPTAVPATTTDEPSPSADELSQGQAYLALAHGADPVKLTERAVAALGGIERFVTAGDKVVVKPNICVDYRGPEYAATTNPEVVATLVRLCLGAGAGRVRVMDMPFGGTPESAYEVSGIAAAVREAGGEMVPMNRAKFVRTKIPDGVDLKEWEFYGDVIQANVVINVPIAKHHSLARLSLGMKNLIGVITDPGRIHSNMGQRVADLASLVRPTLTVVDAVRILMNHGPTGGNLADVKRADTIIASHDFVAADSQAATLFGLKGADISYILAADRMGLGTMDLDAIQVDEFSI